MGTRKTSASFADAMTLMTVFEMTADQCNATFECGGSLIVIASVVRLYFDRVVLGINWLQPVFFTMWGIWNLYYYPYLDQWYSFVGGVLLTTANVSWIALYLYWKYYVGSRNR